MSQRSKLRREDSITTAIKGKVFSLGYWFWQSTILGLNSCFIYEDRRKIIHRRFTMPKNFNPKDLSILAGTVSVEDGIYKIVTRVAGHKPGDTISKERAIELAKFMTPTVSELDRELLRVPSTSSYSSKCEHGNDAISCLEGNCYYYYDDED
jgi:hypothetical protein